MLLQADKSSNSFSDRTMLKSLGHWLGMLTLAKSRPLLHTDVAMKELLLEAYSKERQGQQELLYVVPFVAKVLECAAESKVFKPPNPWVMAIMRVLVELHAKPDLQVRLWTVHTPAAWYSATDWESVVCLSVCPSVLS